MNHQIVRRHPLWETRWFRISLGVAAVLVCIGIYRVGMFGGAVTLASTEKALADATTKNVDLAKSNDQLREQLAMLQRGREVEQVAYQQLKSEMAVTQDEILELKEELSFYRGVLSKNASVRGLRVQHFGLTRGDKANTYHFKLVLTQILKDVTVASGRVSLRVEGMSDGEMKSLDYTDLAVDKADTDLSYRFRYFQNMDGDLQLPDAFKPARVIVTLNPSGQRNANVERAFDWSIEEK